MGSGMGAWWWVVVGLGWAAAARKAPTKSADSFACSQESVDPSTGKLDTKTDHQGCETCCYFDPVLSTRKGCVIQKEDKWMCDKVGPAAGAEDWACSWWGLLDKIRPLCLCKGKLCNKLERKARMDYGLECGGRRCDVAVGEKGLTPCCRVPVGATGKALALPQCHNESCLRPTAEHLLPTPLAQGIHFHCLPAKPDDPHTHLVLGTRHHCFCLGAHCHAPHAPNLSHANAIGLPVPSLPKHPASAALPLIPIPLLSLLTLLP